VARWEKAEELARNKLQSRFVVQLLCGMKPGTPVVTTAFNLCLVWM